MKKEKIIYVQRADQLLTETATPISVVTIDRMSDHVNKSLRIETFAHFLFDQWEIGNVDLDCLDPKDANKGVLLLVSEGDRKARIQLGAGWGREMDRHCQKSWTVSLFLHSSQVISLVALSRVSTILRIW